MERDETWGLYVIGHKNSIGLVILVPKLSVALKRHVEVGNCVEGGKVRG